MNQINFGKDINLTVSKGYLEIGDTTFEDSKVIMVVQIALCIEIAKKKKY